MTYYEANKEKILARQKQRRMNNQESYNAKSRDRYHNAKAARANKIKIRKDEHKNCVRDIAVHYQCQNPKCLWTKSLNAWQLDFHHLDPSTKIDCVSRMHSKCQSSIAQEINKCIVLCKNCHSKFHEDGQLELNESMMCQVDNTLKIIS